MGLGLLSAAIKGAQAVQPLGVFYVNDIDNLKNGIWRHTDSRTLGRNWTGLPDATCLLPLLQQKSADEGEERGEGSGISNLVTQNW